MTDEFKFFVNGEWKSSDATYELRSPYEDRVIGLVHRARPGDVEEAIRGAVEAFDVTRRYSSVERAEVLGKIVAGLKKRKDELARTIVLEAGKCIRHAEAEVGRAICAFTIAMEEAKRMEGTLLPLDRCIVGAFAYQGQICIHLQRLFLHESIYDRFKEAFL